jgi:hypothetical protein
MLKFSQMTVVIVCAAGLSASGCAGQGTPSMPSVPTGADWSYSGGVLFHHPHYAFVRGLAPAVKPLFFQVPYRGGPVIVTPKFYFAFWGYKKYGDPDKVQPLLESYAKVMGGSGHNNIEIQYYEGASGSKTYVTNPAHQYGGSWDDRSPLPGKPTDSQIAAETLRAVGHFGFDPNGVYFVATPHKHSEAGFGSHWCSYHSYAEYNKQPVPYAYFPYIPDAGTACGASAVKPPSDESAGDEGVTIFAGHEFGETITDPQPFSAWTGPQGEIADQCQFSGYANDPFGSKSYTMQPMASNADNACVQSYDPKL